MLVRSCEEKSVTVGQKEDDSGKVRQKKLDTSPGPSAAVRARAGKRGAYSEMNEARGSLLVPPGPGRRGPNGSRGRAPTRRCRLRSSASNAPGRPSISKRLPAGAPISAGQRRSGRSPRAARRGRKIGRAHV